MKTIIAGSRVGVTLEDVRRAVKNCPWNITCIVSGGAIGVDQFGEVIAKENDLPIEQYLISQEDWETYGRGAGHVRNRKMAENAQALIAIWDGKSKGTENMIKEAGRCSL